MTRRLAIVAHYDPRGEVAGHFLRQLDQISSCFDRVIVASPGSLSDAAAAAIADRAELFSRQNYGHDFGSWRDALERVEWAADYDELLLTNDSYVGFFRPLDEIIAEMGARPVDFWGLTATARRGLHVQSYFTYFTRPALHSQAFRRFWMDTKPAPDRMSAILDQEVGLSRALTSSGFAIGAYFSPTRAERLRANARGVHWLYRRQREFPARYDSLSEDYFRARRAYDPQESDNLNTSSAFADSVFDGGRLPVVKFDVLRNDPFWLDSSVLLTDLERTYPAHLQGVRDYIEATSKDYSKRPYENHRFADLSRVERLVIGYSRRKGRSSFVVLPPLVSSTSRGSRR